jgi:murein DD-endopeptidase MepM/ murein hydrolase activator NlpD
VTPRIFAQFSAWLEHYFPEQRLFLKSQTDTRFIRLRPLTQLVAVVFGSLALGWTILATAILLLDSISAGTSREQITRQQGLYEERLNALSDDRDLRAAEASSAQERFNTALKQVAEMQSRLLRSEDRRRELETGIDVIQNTLRRTISERDSARAEVAGMAQTTGRTDAGKVKDAESTVTYLADILGQTAVQRDDIQKSLDQSDAKIAKAIDDKKALEARNDVIFSHLEQALKVTVEPLDQMFRNAGLDPNELIDQARSGYDGQGGPLMPIKLSPNGTPPSAEETRANELLNGLKDIDLYREVAFKTPLSMPVKTSYRYTSGFGYRKDPFGRGTRRHEGQDLAGAYGSPIYATADGVVTHAGWENGYGRLVTIRHPYGFETRYAHLSQIRAKVGQKVSRGDRIGDMGNSGRSTGTHLHYEIRISGTPKNPMTFIKAAKNVF